MIQALRDIRAYFTAGDRRDWLLLLGVSLVAGLCQSLILAVFNDAVAAYGKGLGTSSHLVLLLVLVATSMAVTYAGAVRGRYVASRTAIRIRNQLLDRVGTANLRLVDRVGIAGLHYHLVHTVDQLAAVHGAFLTFTTSLVMLTCNLLYIGWLSPLGLGGALVITVIGVAVHFRQEALNLINRRRLDAFERSVDARHHEAIRGYQELRLSDARTADYRARIDRDNENAVVEGLRVARTSAAGDVATLFFQHALIFLLVFALPLAAAVDAVVLMQMMTAVFVTVGPLSGMIGAIPRFSDARVAVANLRGLEAEIAATGEPAARAGGTLPAFASLELRGLCFDFGAGARDDAFRLGPVDLEVRRGDVLFVVGGNGSGKSVLMRVLTGLYHHTAGEIRYNGRPVEDAQRQAYREQLSAVFADFHLFRELLGAGKADPARVQHWLERLDLAGKTRYADGEFDTVALSAGQRKRLAFLVAMLEDRPVLVLDEFGAEQDPAHRRRFYRELLPELKAQGKTVIVVTHDDAYYDAADRVIRMDYGRIVEDSSTARGIAASRKAS